MMSNGDLPASISNISTPNAHQSTLKSEKKDTQVSLGPCLRRWLLITFMNNTHRLNDTLESMFENAADILEKCAMTIICWKTASRDANILSVLDSHSRIAPWSPSGKAHKALFGNWHHWVQPQCSILSTLCVKTATRELFGDGSQSTDHHQLISGSGGKHPASSASNTWAYVYGDTAY